MKKKFFYFISHNFFSTFLSAVKIILFFFFSFSFSFANDDDAVDLEQFPENIIIKFEDKDVNLKRTGSTIRKKFFFKIYEMAHYIDEEQVLPSNNEEVYDAILQQNVVKQISTIYLRSIKVEQIKESLLSDFRLNTEDEEFTNMLPHINAFLDVIDQDVEENDKFVLQRFPDGTIVSLFQGKVISTIKDENFARTIWSIWFGRFAVVNRETLIKDLLSNS